jgi:hypothetical protein
LRTADSDAVCAQGIIARERGLSHLRLNKAKEAYDYFLQAKAIFSKAMIGDYLFRLKTHEAESLIRLNRLDEAFFENALKVFEAVYWKDYEFTKYYVEENLKLSQ